MDFVDYTDFLSLAGLPTSQGKKIWVFFEKIIYQRKTDNNMSNTLFNNPK
jgi:hypothetical protein